MTSWRDNQDRFAAVARGNPQLEAALPISADVAALAGIGLDAVIGADSARCTIDTGVEGLFLRSPTALGRCGSNGNVNGLLRQYFPKGTHFSVHTPTRLDAVATELNARPRETLGWLSPFEAFARVVAMTA